MALSLGLFHASHGHRFLLWHAIIHAYLEMVHGNKAYMQNLHSRNYISGTITFKEMFILGKVITKNALGQILS